MKLFFWLTVLINLVWGSFMLYNGIMGDNGLYTGLGVLNLVTGIWMLGWWRP